MSRICRDDVYDDIQNSFNENVALFINEHNGKLLFDDELIALLNDILDCWDGLSVSEKQRQTIFPIKRLQKWQKYVLEGVAFRRKYKYLEYLGFKRKDKNFEKYVEALDDNDPEIWK